ncbi:MAG: hypothetical protein K2Y71_04975 [Xanthobacteraceae bacterium]|nr:hypothetical protein [Xanthobacteraceae bacterium]
MARGTEGRPLEAHPADRKQRPFQHRVTNIEFEGFMQHASDTIGLWMRKHAGRPRGVGCQLALSLCFLLLAPSSSFSQVVCKPFLSIMSVKEDRTYTSTLQWKWNATLRADNTYCATRSGNFEVDFVRIKDNSPDIQFTQKFRWSQGPFSISMELTSDEAILDSRIGFIAPCVCREIDQLSVDYRPR